MLRPSAPGANLFPARVGPAWPALLVEARELAAQLLPQAWAHLEQMGPPTALDAVDALLVAGWARALDGFLRRRAAAAGGAR